MTIHSGNTGNNHTGSEQLPTKQELRDLNKAFREGSGSSVLPEKSGLPPEQLTERIDYLKEFMLPERYEGLCRRMDERTRYMVMCLEDIYYPHNASAVIRSSEAFGIQEMHAVERTVRFSPSKKIVRGTDQWVDLRKWSDTPSLVEYLRGERGYRIVVTAPPKGGEVLPGNTPSGFDVAGGPFALFMGTEKSGISDWLMEAADDFICIPMVGFAESLNISVSAAIVAQRLTERLRDPAEGIHWQLASDDREQLLYKWLYGSVKDAKRILERGGF